MIPTTSRVPRSWFRWKVRVYVCMLCAKLFIGHGLVVSFPRRKFDDRKSKIEGRRCCLGEVRRGGGRAVPLTRAAKWMYAFVRKEKGRAWRRALFSNVLYINYMVQLSNRSFSFMNKDVGLVVKTHETKSIIIFLQGKRRHMQGSERTRNIH